MPLAALRCSRLLLERARASAGIVRARSERSLLCELPGPSFVWLLAPALSLNPRAATCRLDALSCEVGAEVRCTAAWLELGAQRVSLLEAEPWDPRWRGGSAPTATTPPPEQPLPAELARALAGCALDDADALVTGLLGLGAGSTPAGDDLLLGLRAAWRLRGASQLPALDAAVRARARRATAPVAAEMLLDASEDRYPEAVQLVLAALLARSSLPPALLRLRELGASSGVAMEWGIHLGLRVSARA